MTTYFGFAISDSMFDGEVNVNRRPLTTDDGINLATEAVPCLNPSHISTITAMNMRFGLEVAIPAKPPIVRLASGDRLLVLSVRGLPRLTDRHEYTDSEIQSAVFQFALWSVE